jgi:hypothetical protein
LAAVGFAGIRNHRIGLADSAELQALLFDSLFKKEIMKGLGPLLAETKVTASTPEVAGVTHDFETGIREEL